MLRFFCAPKFESSKLTHPTNAKKASGYLPGSVVRVKLTNFVTFDSVEFFPGPSLNLVIGPNGSGKSTLVAAMCLGLGGKATVCQLLLSIAHRNHRS